MSFYMSIPIICNDIMTVTIYQIGTSAPKGGTRGISWFSYLVKELDHDVTI